MYRGLAPILLLLASVENENFVVNAEKAATEEEEEQPCGLWLAPSHLAMESRPRFGVFAGIDYDKHEYLPNPEVAIPVVDLVRDLHKGLSNELFDFMESKLWVSGFGGVAFEGNHTSYSFIPGVGSLANYHSGIINAEYVQASVFLRERSNNGIADPGEPHPSRGNISPYHNVTMRTTQRIPAGMEIFPDYGTNYDTPDEDIYEERILRQDYMNADVVLDRILDFMDKYESQMSADFQDSVLDFMLENTLDLAGGGRGAKAIRSLIPAHPKKIRKVREMGGTFAYRNKDMIKSQKWLEEHGLCIDNLRSGLSTIPDAGRGAFAKRQIKEEGVIAPVPMIPILDEELLRMYEIGEKEQNGVAKPKTPISDQLLLNYCFAHRESTLLLLPTAPVVGLINHASSRESSKEGGANAKLTWSKHQYLYNDRTLLSRPLDEWSLTETFVITMLLVATRDIEEGEEILLDYGDSWVEAWEEYKSDWTKKTTENPKWPQRAEDVQLLYKDKPYPVNVQPDQTPYPETVVTTCFMVEGDVPDGQPYQTKDGISIRQWNGPDDANEYKGHSLSICDLLDRTESEDHMYVYTVLVQATKGSDFILVKGVPHSAIIFSDKPYKGDIHTSHSFRRWIDLEDRLFPQAWRNLRD